MLQGGGDSQRYCTSCIARSLVCSLLLLVYVCVPKHRQGEARFDGRAGFFFACFMRCAECARSSGIHRLDSVSPSRDESHHDQGVPAWPELCRQPVRPLAARRV